MYYVGIDWANENTTFASWTPPTAGKTSPANSAPPPGTKNSCAASSPKTSAAPGYSNHINRWARSDIWFEYVVRVDSHSYTG